MTKILGVETSCDDTAVSIVEDGNRILSNLVSSQVDIHARYGGVIPEVASRQHLLTIIPLLRQALQEANTDLKDLSAVAVTFGPGLAGSLLVGVSLAKSLCLALDLPLVGINHLEGHIYANWLRESSPLLPCLCLIVSGGHTELVLMRGHGDFLLLGRTRDDACGEAFDKVARILGLGYPGGPAIERAAIRGDPSSFALPHALLRGSHDFSFSGLKTAVLHLWGGREGLSPFDVAASFQATVVDILVTKTLEAAKEIEPKQILLAGGVAANGSLRQEFMRRSKIPVCLPPPSLCTDNAAMIACCGYFNLREGRRSDLSLDILPNAGFAEGVGFEPTTQLLK